MSSASVIYIVPRGGCLKNVSRIVLTVLMALSFIYLLILNSLAAYGVGPFKRAGGFTWYKPLESHIMPMTYYHYVLIVKYIALLFLTLYATIVMVQQVSDKLSRTYNRALPILSLAMLVISYNLNVAWLFAEDGLDATGSYVIILFVFLANSIALFCSAYRFYIYSQRQYQQSKFGFWMGVGVLNSLAVNTAWSIIQFIISLSVSMTKEKEIPEQYVRSGTLCVFLMLAILWFIIENMALKSILNTVFLHYIILLWYMILLYVRQAAVLKSRDKVLYISNLVASSVFVVLRLVFLYHSNRGNKQYKA